MKRLFTSLVILALTACGGGGGSNNDTVIPPDKPAYTGPIHFGYFYSGLQLEEVINHVDINFEPYLGDFHGLFNRLALSKRENIRTILDLGTLLFDRGICRHDAGDRLSYYLQRISDEGFAKDILGFYPLDEPDLNSNSESLRQCNEIIRHYQRQHSEYAEAVILTIYSDHGFPAIETFDWVGTNGGDYWRGIPAVPPISARQGIILIPGGADPWRIPAASVKPYISAYNQVRLVLPFLWVNGAGGTGLGISSNGLAHEYCELGLELTKKEGVCK